MPLDPGTLATGLVPAFTAQTADQVAPAWSAALVGYWGAAHSAAAGTLVKVPAKNDALLQDLRVGFRCARDPFTTAGTIAAAATVWWTGAVFAAPAGAATVVPPTLAATLATVLVAQAAVGLTGQLTHADSARAVAGAIDAWTRTIVTTSGAVVGPVV